MPSRSHFCSHPFLLHMAGVAAVQPLPLLSAICRSSPHEAGGGTRCMAPQVKSRRAFLVRCAKAARRRKLLLADPGSIKMNGSD